MRFAALIVGLALLPGLPALAQSTVLVQSDGTSLTQFICDYGQATGGGSINASDGQGVPSIEFYSSSATVRRAAPYVLHGLPEGKIFHGVLDFKLEPDHDGYVNLGMFGVPTDSVCSFPTWPGGRWPIPSFGYRASAERLDWVVAGPTGVENVVQPNGSFPISKGVWHRADLVLCPLSDGTNHWQFRIDGELAAEGLSYEPITGPTELGLEIGSGGSGSTIHAKFDNMTVQVLDFGHFATRLEGHSAAPFNPAVILGPPAAPGTDFDGVPGFVTVGFDGTISDGPGDDVAVYLTGFQPNQQFVEDFYLLASEDGSNFVQIGYANPNNFNFGPQELVKLEFDLADGGLSTATSIKLRNGQQHGGTSSEGPDLIAFEALHFLPSQLDANYPLDTDVQDISGNNLHGVPYEDGIAANPLVHVSGAVGGAAHFDGASDHVQLPTGVLDPTESFTVAACVQSTRELDRWQSLVVKSGGNAFNVNHPFVNLAVSRSGYAQSRLSFHLSDGDGVHEYETLSNLPVIDGSWHQATAVYDSNASEMRLYIDGELNDSLPTPGYQGFNNSTDVFVGAATDGANGVLVHDSVPAAPLQDHFEGKIDELRFYSRALGAGEVGKLWQSTCGGLSSPVVTVDHGSVSVAEGSTATNSGSFVDPDAGDIVTIEASVGNVTASGGAGSGSWSWSLDTTDGPSESQTVIIMATDSTGSTSMVSFALTVDNVDPLVTFTLSNDPVAEGGSVVLTGAIVDPGILDGHTVSIAWGDGAVSTLAVGAGVGGFAANHQYVDDNPTGTPSDMAPIVTSVIDTDGGAGSASGNATVTNVLPEFGTIPDLSAPVPAGSTVSVTIPFTDIGVADTHTCTVDWDDPAAPGAAPGTVTETGGAGDCSANYLFSDPGVYAVAVTLTDDDTGSISVEPGYIVVYDAGAGFVTGGGWINSPLGAYTADPTLTGKAHFGFTSKYQKGANVPTGNTNFRFQTAGFIFESTQYDWLVVAGARAQFKGSGTINGAGDFGFLLTAIDGEVNGGGGDDKFRIKVVDKTSGNIIYDNKLGESDDIDMTDPQVIGAGAIKIHSGNGNGGGNQ